VYVLSGSDALEKLDDPQCVERGPDDLGADLVQLFGRSATSFVPASDQAARARRRSSWLAARELTPARVEQGLIGLPAEIREILALWERRQISSMNDELRRASWRIVCRLLLGVEGDETVLSHLCAPGASREQAGQRSAKQQLTEWIEDQVDRIVRAAHVGGSNGSLAAELLSTKTLSRNDVVSDLHQAYVATARLWEPLTQALYELSADAALDAAVRAELRGLRRGQSVHGMSRTPTLSGLIREALHLTTPVAYVYARAIADFRVGDTTVPAGAIVLGTLQATNQPSQRFEDPAGDLTTAVMWLFLSGLLESHTWQPLDETDVPILQDDGFFPARGFYVRFSRVDPSVSPQRVPADAAARPRAAAARPEVPRVGREARVAIVGGGITGLTIAHDLHGQGFRNVTVFEQSASVGGKADTVEVDGFPYNLGAHLCHGDHGVAGIARGVGVPLVREGGYTLWDIESNRAMAHTHKELVDITKFQKRPEGPAALAPGFARSKLRCLPRWRHGRRRRLLKGCGRPAPSSRGLATASSMKTRRPPIS
jgi:cytochrome P450